LIISRKTILRYQLLFRFLLHLKHAEQALCAMWADQQSAPWRVRAGPELTAWRRRVSVLRARMLAFVQHVLAFAVHDVLEPNSRALDDKLRHVRTVDGLLRDHVDFLDTCLKGCMLTTTKLVEVGHSSASCEEAG
jgi:gamma-tubulin complex component 2